MRMRTCFESSQYLQFGRGKSLLSQLLGWHTRLGRSVVLLWLVISGIAAAEPPAQSDPVLLGEVESAIVEGINEYRKENDLTPVRSDEDLERAAEEFASFMAKTGKYGHHADGRTPAERAQAANYRYCVVRENIAYRSNTGDPDTQGLSEAFVQGWIDSPPHRENILADYVTDTGVGVATSDHVTFYAVQLFGRPKAKSIRMSVSNRSGQSRTLTIESNDSVDEIDLQPLMSVRTRRCFPAKLRLADDDTAIRVEESGNWVVTEEGLKREDSGGSEVNEDSSDR